MRLSIECSFLRMGEYSPCGASAGGSVAWRPVLASRLDESYAVEVRAAITPLTIAKVTANSAYRYVSPFIATVASGLDISLATIGTAIAISEIVGLSAPLIIRFSGAAPAPARRTSAAQSRRRKQGIHLPARTGVVGHRGHDCTHRLGTGHVRHVRQMAPGRLRLQRSQGLWLPSALGAVCAAVTLLCHLRYRATRGRATGSAIVTASPRTTSR